MKKLLFISLLIVTCNLTSCDAHFGDIHFQVPWWSIAIFVVLILVLVIVIEMRSVTSKLYTCPECEKTFTPKWHNFSALVSKKGEICIKCPHCKKHVVAPVSWKNY